MATAQRTYDVEAYFARPDARRRTELIGGRIVMNEPTWRHQLAVTRLLGAISVWIGSSEGRGVVNLAQDIPLTEHDALAPDLIWYSDPARVDPSTHVQAVPDLVVEVRSPSTWARDVGVKRRLYEQYGLPELWLVDTSASSILTFRRSSPSARHFDRDGEVGSGAVLTSPAMPGFAIDVGTLLDL